MSVADELGTEAGAPSPVGETPAAARGGNGRMRVSPAVLLTLNALLMLLLTAGMLGLFLWRQGDGAPSGAAWPPAPAPAAVAPRPQPAQTRPAAQPRSEPVSWKLAQAAYDAGHFALAERRYRRLVELAAATPGNTAVRDFFRFRVGHCLARSGRLEEARTLLGQVAASDAPVVRAAANYDLAVLDFLAGDYLPARVRAYRAMAALESMQVAVPLRRDCDYVITRAMTAKVLGFHERPLKVPLDERWTETDIFSGAEEKPLRRLLEDGRGAPEEALLGARVSRVAAGGLVQRYAVACNQAPLDELLQRLGVETGMGVRWAAVAPRARQRTITAAFRAAGPQRICEIAAGMAGLVARFTGEEVILHDPRACPTLAEQRDLLHDEAISAWRRFFLRNPNDARRPLGHYALAALHGCAGETLEAMKEYQLIATRFPKSSVAGLALLRGARLRIRLRDYVGARSDLMELLNLYPNCESLDEVYLYLGQASLNAGLLEEAISVFRKLYYLDLSLLSRKQGCLGAAEAFSRMGDPKEACRWLERYFRLPELAPGPEAAEAYLMLGRSLAALGRLPAATKALSCALTAKPTPRQRTRGMLRLALIHRDRRRFVRALGALNQIDPPAMTAAQRAEYLLTTARVYRSMGLADKALVLLRRELPSIREESTMISIGLEMVACHMDEDDLASARALLGELLPKMAAGAKAIEAACDLAEVCLADGRAPQAISICREIYPSAGAEARQRILDILGRAHVQRKDYDRAALAFAGVMPRAEGGRTE